jgi:hypothetical protein
VTIQDFIKEVMKMNRDEILEKIKKGFEAKAKDLDDGMGRAALLDVPTGRSIFEHKNEPGMLKIARIVTDPKNKNDQLVEAGVYIDNLSDDQLAILEADISGEQATGERNPFLPIDLEGDQDGDLDNPFLPKIDD